MDRELQVLKSGHILGKVTFTYQSETNAIVDILINNIVDIGAGLQTVVPLYKYSRELSHDPFSSITKIKSFDLRFFKELPDVKKQLKGTIEYIYLPARYRYLMGPGGETGISNIQANFSDNKKELQFISTRGMHADHQLSANSIETNIGLLKRLCESAGLGCADGKFELVDSKS